MRTSCIGWAACVFTCIATACGPDADERSLGEGGGPGETPQRQPHGLTLADTATDAWWNIFQPRFAAPAPDLLAWTLDGDLAVVDGHTGAVKQASPALGLAGTRDVAFDPWKHRAVIFEGDDEAQHGEVAAYPIAKGATGPTVGARAHLASEAGDARLLPTPLGLAVFEEAGGGRWRMLFNGGSPSASVPGPAPASTWLTATSTEATLHALSYAPSAGELDVATATIFPASIGAASLGPVSVPAATLPPSARLVPAPARGGALLVDIGGSFLTVRGVSGAAAGSPAQVPLGHTGLRIEGAVPLFGGAVVVLLVSGKTELVAVAIDEDLHITSLAQLALPGDLAPATPCFARSLAAQGPGKVLAATSAGVFSVAVWQGTIGIKLGLAPGFDGTGLRGPVDAIWPLPG